MRSGLAAASVVTLLVLALALGLATEVDRDGNLDMYTSNPVVLLAFCALDIAALYALGMIVRPSASAFASSLVAMLTVLAYYLVVVARHPGKFDSDYSLPVDIGVAAFGTASLVAEVVLLAGLLGAGASVVYLGGRWLRDNVWPRLGAHLHHERPRS